MPFAQTVVQGAMFVLTIKSLSRLGTGEQAMTKAKSLNRLELTRQKMAAREAMKHGHGIMAEVTEDNVKAWQEYFSDTPAAPGAEEHQEHFDEHSCPMCGGELVRHEGCYRCKKCGWSKCG